MTETSVQKISVIFCDKTTTERVYDNTNWGRLTARDDFMNLCDQGEHNFGVMAKTPHIVSVTWEMPESSRFEHFSCSCKKGVRSA